MDINNIVYFGEKAVEVDSLPDNSVTKEQFQSARMNSYAFEKILPKLNNEALKYVVEHHLVNCRREPRSTYDWSMKTNLIPELLRRMSTPKKVWIVTHGNYEEQTTEFILGNKIEADKLYEILSSQSHYYNTPEEHDLYSKASDVLGEM